MEPCLAKRLWHMIRAACYSIRKGFFKHKLIMDLHLLLCRRKLAAKFIRNLLTSHHTDPEECCVSPAFFLDIPDDTPSGAEISRSSRRRRRHHQPVDVAALNMTLAMLSPDPHSASPLQASARQLRITDSPFSVEEVEEVEEVAEDGGSVDRQAYEFIRWFREQLRLQSSVPGTPEYQLRRLRTPARDGSDQA